MGRGKRRPWLERTAFDIAGDDASVDAVRMVEAVFKSLPFSYTRDEIIAVVCEGDYPFSPLVPDEIGRAVDELIAAGVLGPDDARGVNLSPADSWNPPHVEVHA